MGGDLHRPDRPTVAGESYDWFNISGACPDVNIWATGDQAAPTAAPGQRASAELETSAAPAPSVRQLNSGPMREAAK